MLQIYCQSWKLPIKYDFRPHRKKMDAPPSSSSLKRELESSSSTNSPSPSKKRQYSGTPLKSTTLKRIKLDSEEQLNEPTEQEALVDEIENFGEDPEEDPDVEVEFIADGDVLEDEAVLAQVLGVDVVSTSAGPTATEQQEETNRAEDRKLLALMAHFNEDQLSRFEAFRRATFTKSAVNRIISSVSQTTFSPNVVIAMSGITKVFVGELVEEEHTLIGLFTTLRLRNQD